MATKQLRTGDKIAALTRCMTLERASLDEDTRTVDVTFSTETDEVERYFGVEILDHSDGAVDLSRMNNAAPLLMDHDPNDQRGVVVVASINNRAGKATVRFSKSKRGQELLDDVRDGIRSKISVGYIIKEFQHEGQRADGVDIYRATSWQPIEISSVSIPFDEGATVDGREWGERTAELQNSVKVTSHKTPTMKENQAVEAPKEDQRADAAVAAPEAPAPKAETRSAEPQLTAADVKRAAADEADRRDDIRSLGAEFGIDEKEVRKAISDEISADEFGKVVLAGIRAQNQPIQTGVAEVEADRPQSGSASHTVDAWRGQAIDALGARGQVLVGKTYAKPIEDNRQFLDGGQRQLHRALTGGVTLGMVAASDVGIGSNIINETTISAPELDVIPASTISGSTVELSVQTEAPSVAFRNSNEGSARKSAEFESKVFQTSVIEEQIAVDIQGVLNSSKDPGRVLSSQAAAVSKSVMQHVAEQTYYAGTAQSGADTKASPGLIAQSNSAATHVVDAGGNSAKSSVWLLELGEDSVDYVFGNDTMLNFGSWNEETVDDNAGLPFRALVNYLSGRVAPRVANKNGAIRIKNIEEDTLKLTVEFMYAAFQLADTLGSQPNAIFLSPRSLYQLRDDMQGNVTNNVSVPPPTSFGGVPLYMTNNISIAETV